MSVRQGSSIIAIGNVAVDGDTVSFNGNASLQANGVMNKNTAVGATEKIYDWVGTLAEYTAQGIAINHPDWLCFITDDDASDFVDFADINASNFTNAGKTYLSGLGMPSDTDVEDITVLATNAQYTAPANGWFQAIGTAPSSGNSYILLSTNNATLREKRQIVRTTNYAGKCGVMLPVLAGEEVTFGYGMTDVKLRFFYAEGDKTNS